MMERRTFKHGSRLLMSVVVLAVVSLVVVVGGNSSNTVSDRLSGPNTAMQSDPILIGHNYASDGWMSFYDKPIHQFAQLAVDDINKSGGVLGRQLKLINYNMKTQPKLGATGILRLKDQGAKAFIVT